MAKGRKQGSDPHDRLLLGNFGYGQGYTAGSDLPDLREEDVWSAIAVDGACGDGDGDGGAAEVPYGWRRRGRDHDENGGRWLGGKEDRPVGGLSLAFEDAAGGSSTRVVHQYRNVDSSATSKGGRCHHHHAPSSAPVSVPNWPRILRVDSSESIRSYDGCDADDGEWVPPHEYLAREYAKSGQSVANSVFEGVGRTLKGRDMRRVRDAVWSQTGFFG
ncbi:hypothetical protein Taro_032211 [Colocasia esculenta]|uniref:Senescence regulator n=1 Tax=Colocasia esculenta TaxID=4460 RepID=A0A843VWP8_COLES|nr:hypothetical protein [Colocasia esculenta]